MSKREVVFYPLTKWSWRKKLKSWLYWRYRYFVMWVASFDNLHVLPRENFDDLQDDAQRYWTLREWTKELKQDRVSVRDYANVVSNIVEPGANLAKSQEERLSRKDLVPTFGKEIHNEGKPCDHAETVKR